MGRFRTIVQRGLIGILVILIGVAGWVLSTALGAYRLEHVALASDLHVFMSPLGNTTLLLTPDGAIVVDPLGGKYGEQLQAQLQPLVRSLPVPEVKYLLITHPHLEVVEGLSAFGEGPITLASVATLSRLQSEPSLLGKSEASKAALGRIQALPEERDHQLSLGPMLFHAVLVGTGHTGADRIYYFPLHKLVVAGDLLYSGIFPHVDRAAGGSYLTWVETLDRLMALGPARLVPGHGPVLEPSDARAFQGYLRDLIQEAARLKAAGKTKEQVVAELTLPIHQERLKPLYKGVFLGYPLGEPLTTFARNVSDVYDELAAGGVIPERPQTGVDATDGDPGDSDGEEGSPAKQAP